MEFEQFTDGSMVLLLSVAVVVTLASAVCVVLSIGGLGSLLGGMVVAAILFGGAIALGVGARG